MEAMEAILTRRSIRRYLKDPVPKELLAELLEAAMSAPSASNEQPWQFVVLTEPEVLGSVPKYHPYSSMVPQAQAAVLVCGDLGLARGMDWWVQGCAAATQNLLLAARAKGLGAVWLGVYPDRGRVSGMRELLGLPESIAPFALVPLGWPAEPSRKADRYREERVRYNRW